MNEISFDINEITNNGFTIIENIYSSEQIENIISAISQADASKETFRKSTDLFAVRQFLKEIPDSIELIFNENLKKIVREFFGKDFFVIKSIYFDKPEKSNWFVSYHQDLTISVDKKTNIIGYGPWTIKHQQFAVQPPLEILENIYTIRIHLDNTVSENGALRVIPHSHKKGIFRPETIDWAKEKEITCNVKKGGIMIMKPLLLHSSSRTTNNAKRRVIHIEFSNKELPNEIMWVEKLKK